MMAPEAFEAEAPASVGPNPVPPAVNDVMDGTTAGRSPLRWPQTSRHAQGHAQEPMPVESSTSNSSDADSADDGELWQGGLGRVQINADVTDELSTSDDCPRHPLDDGPRGNIEAD